jgi:hypothetical protein
VASRICLAAPRTKLDRTVAIKVLPSDKVADPDRKRRFVRQAKAASALPRRAASDSPV